MTTTTIVAYDIYTYSAELQKAVLEGYRITDQGDDAPALIGFMFHAVLHKEEQPSTCLGKLHMEVSVDTSKIQEQLKEGGDVEQAITGALVVEQRPQQAAKKPAGRPVKR